MSLTELSTPLTFLCNSLIRRSKLSMTRPWFKICSCRALLSVSVLLDLSENNALVNVNLQLVWILPAVPLPILNHDC